MLEAPKSTGICQTIFSHFENRGPYLLMYLRIKAQCWRTLFPCLICSEVILLFVMDLPGNLE